MIIRKQFSIDAETDKKLSEDASRLKLSRSAIIRLAVTAFNPETITSKMKANP
jgi:hypothetical protein